MKKQKPKKCDIKYLEIPNICFSLTRKGDDREKKYKKQRIKRGFDDSETWSLRDTIARFIIPRLELYEEFANKIIIRDDKLKKDIQLFLEAMKLISRNNGICIWNKKEEKIVSKGLNAFPRMFMSLWW
jgi:hypothetical protein